MSSKPLIDVTVDGPVWLVVETTVVNLSPVETLTWFTDAAKLNRWWGEEAMIEPRPGGLYEVHWPSMDWTMRGVVALCSVDTLIYSWTWDHEPDQPPRIVAVHVEPTERSTKLTMTHGPYRPESTGEEDARLSHRDGWLYFLSELHETMTQTVGELQ